MPTTVSPATPPPLAITLFGPLRALVVGQPLPPLHSRKALWLLALLALRAGRPVEREWLAGSLWPDADQDQAFANLRPVLSDLRRVLGDQSARLQSPSRHTLCLDLANADVDVLVFDAAIIRGTLPSLAQAVALYTGPLLEGCAEEWAPQERRVREEDCLRALHTLADAALAAGDYEAACKHYRRAASLDPWQDSARRGLMEALAIGGDSNGALQVYREFVALLRADPKAAPDDQTRALYARLRAGRRSGGGPAAEAASPVTSAAVAAGYLPHPVTDLVGREDERLEVAARLRRSRLVTLMGPGGIGKTRLAIEVAREAALDFVDGVWLVALDALTEGRLVERQIASVLGLKEAPGQPLREGLTGHLCTRRLLLVLDNCEHLLEESAQITGHLLRECAGVRILATSRVALGITGETTWAVPGLTVPDPAHLPQAPATLLRMLMGYESVQLFVERALAVQRAFSLTDANAPAVAEVCSRLEGIPLAIELAAVRVKALTVAQIAARLGNYLGLLTGGSRVGPYRQRTLRATLDWSYDLLSPAQQVLLGHVSVFAGGWCLEAAEHVCAGPGIDGEIDAGIDGENGLTGGLVLDLLTSLTDQSLVVFGARESEARVFGERYHLLETVRQYAAERQAASGEAEHIRARHRDYFLALAEEAEPRLTGAEQGAWLARLEEERANLRAALEWCGLEKDGAEAGLRLAGALGRFWEMHAYYSEGRASLSQALRREGAGGRTPRRAKALNAAGMLAFYQGDYREARSLHEESLVISRDLEDGENVAWALHYLGNLASAQGDYGEARSLHEESLTIFREVGSQQGTAWALFQLGNWASVQGDTRFARSLHEEGLAISRKLGNRQGTAWALHFLGGLLWEQADRGEAQSFHEESLAIFRELGNRQGIAWALQHLGDLAFHQGDIVLARSRHEESLATFRGMGSQQGAAWSLHHLGILARAQGDYGEARSLHEESLTIFREVGSQQGIARSLEELGKIAFEQADYGEAQSRHEESLAISQELNNRQGVAWALHFLGNLARAQGDYGEARSLHEESLTIFREVGSQQGIARSLNELGRIALEQGHFVPASALYARGMSIQREQGDRRGAAIGLRGLAAGLAAKGNVHKAACIWGIAEALCETAGEQLLFSETATYALQVARTRLALGESVFTAAWQEGRALRWEQAIVYALGDTEPPRPL